MSTAREMVQQVVVSWKSQRDIGKSRTNKVRGWVAQQVLRKRRDRPTMGRQKEHVSVTVATTRLRNGAGEMDSRNGSGVGSRGGRPDSTGTGKKPRR